MKPDDKPERVFNTLQEAIRFFCRHLVSLAGWYQLVDADRFAPDAKSTQPIPFDYSNTAKLPVVDREAGLDFGLILLSRYYRNLLEADGVCANFGKRLENHSR